MFRIYPGHVSSCSNIFYSCFLFPSLCFSSLFFFPLLSADSTCIDSMTHMALPAFHTRHADTVCVSMIYVENLQNMDRCGKHPTEGYCKGNVVAGPAFRACLIAVDDLDLYTALAYPLVIFSTLTFSLFTLDLDTISDVQHIHVQF